MVNVPCLLGSDFNDQTILSCLSGRVFIFSCSFMRTVIVNFPANSGRGTTLSRSGFVSRSRRLKRNKNVFLRPLVKLSIVGSLRGREVACSASELQGLNFKSCVLLDHRCRRWTDIDPAYGKCPKLVSMVRGSCQVKNLFRYPTKTWIGQTPTTHPPIQFFWKYV